jgi:hypothetical protein
MNYPSGTTQRDITNLCNGDNRYPNRHDCILCNREIEQDDDTRWWFFAADFTDWRPTHRCDFTDAFETHAGWVCSAACWNDHALDLDEVSDLNEEVEPGRPFLVKGGAA